MYSVNDVVVVKPPVRIQVESKRSIVNQVLFRAR